MLKLLPVLVILAVFMADVSSHLVLATPSQSSAFHRVSEAREQISKTTEDVDASAAQYYDGESSISSGGDDTATTNPSHHRNARDLKLPFNPFPTLPGPYDPFHARPGRPRPRFPIYVA
ncbi:unnamed protein product [Colias eurytheme]|nr:unnamed protein product [Colias eurytheme]